VIAIMSILAALLMPAIEQARQRAMQVDCLSRLKNIGHAVSFYAMDNDQRLPGVGASDGTQFFGFHAGWGEQVNFSQGYLSQYVGRSADIWQCPSFPEGAYQPRADGPTTGYAYNYEYLNHLVEQGDWWDPDYSYEWVGWGTGILKHASKTLLFGDSATNWMGPMQENWYWTPPSQGLVWGNAYTHFRHNGQANVVWADGHVDSHLPHNSVPLDKDDLGVICSADDEYFDPRK
jgi:prepilin-type processing-associated H-X9-DG protein